MQTYASLCVGMILLTGCAADSGRDIRAEAAGTAEVAFSLLDSSAGTENPDKPKPKPGDICPSCDGRGYNGDGRNAATCKACDGTGKVPFPRRDVPMQRVTTFKR